MSNPLAIYLHDHLAGAQFAADLVKSLRDQHCGEELGQFAEALLPEIEHDRVVLREVIDTLDEGTASLKKATAAVAEKVAQLKLRRGAGGGLGTFESLEALALGILGKRALWRALAATTEADARLHGLDFGQLAARAESQYDRVEQHRLKAARAVLMAKQ
jgi:hypothetical protein